MGKAPLAAQGTRVADDFDRFYAASYQRVLKQLVLVTGDVAEAEDVVQEAFARASVRWQRLCAYEAPEAWVRRVALNLAAQAAGGNGEVTPGARTGGTGSSSCGRGHRRAKGRRQRCREVKPRAEEVGSLSGRRRRRLSSQLFRRSGSTVATLMPLPATQRSPSPSDQEGHDVHPGSLARRPQRRSADQRVELAPHP
ncbi:MAG TPA: sigma factor [Actinomycetes bacterium]